MSPIPNFKIHLFLEASYNVCLHYFGYVYKINGVVNASGWRVQAGLNFCCIWSKSVWIWSEFQFFLVWIGSKFCQCQSEPNSGNSAKNVRLLIFWLWISFYRVSSNIVIYKYDAILSEGHPLYIVGSMSDHGLEIGLPFSRESILISNFITYFRFPRTSVLKLYLRASH